MGNLKIRLGMIGGGEGSFIGAVHRIAARMDNEYDLVAGAFSSDPQKSRSTGTLLGIAESRVYENFAQMIDSEAALPEDKRIQVVSIVTPNHLHFEPAALALDNGFNVILDKPATFTLAQALELKEIIDRTDTLFCLTHTYTGYPMIKEARHIVASGKLGDIKKVYVEYPQGWLSRYEEGTENKQASWRTDPQKSGIAGAMGDIGTHAFNLAEYVSTLKVSKICADINTVVSGRKLDDDGAVLLKFSNGASGVLIATQIAAGEENNLRIRVYGSLGGLEWQQDDANTLKIKWLDKPAEILRTGGAYLSSFSKHNTRVPSGHPEGYLEAFANIYRNFALTLGSKISGTIVQEEWLDFPGIEEGIRGMAFIEHVIKSGKSESKWIDFII